MSIFNFRGHILTALYGRTDNWRHIYKQTTSTFKDASDFGGVYLHGQTKCLKNSVLVLVIAWFQVQLTINLTCAN